MSEIDTASHAAAWGGFDLSTTGLSLGVRSRNGSEAFVQTAMRGATTWHGQPAFDLAHVPRMIDRLLDHLGRDGWTFTDMAVSFSVRQHDMVLIGRDRSPLTPALSWQCDVATREVVQLRRAGAEATVDRIEARFILPKLLWALRQERGLRRSVQQVMTTGDWIAAMLTGKPRLSTSDAMSNGLLDQRSKTLANDVFIDARLNPQWFPKVVASGRLVGRVANKRAPTDDPAWVRVRNHLVGARVVAGLGDNHATGVGCGLNESDTATIVISAGTSGTINRLCGPRDRLAGNAACFEFYKNRLLLMMLADCAAWYDRFVQREAPRYVERLHVLDTRASRANLDHVRRVLCPATGRLVVPPNWSRMSLGEKTASTQSSIMLELLFRVRAMLSEVENGSAVVNTFILTGGLSQSPFFQQVFHAGINLLLPHARTRISARSGPMRTQTATYGALLNAMRPTDPRAASGLCPTIQASRPTTSAKKQLQYFLRAHGLDTTRHAP